MSDVESDWEGEDEVGERPYGGRPYGGRPYGDGRTGGGHTGGGHTAGGCPRRGRTEGDHTVAGRTAAGRTEVGRTEVDRTAAGRTEAGRTAGGGQPTGVSTSTSGAPTSASCSVTDRPSCSSARPWCQSRISSGFRTRPDGRAPDRLLPLSPLAISSSIRLGTRSTRWWRCRADLLARSSDDPERADQQRPISPRPCQRSGQGHARRPESAQGHQFAGGQRKYRPRRPRPRSGGSSRRFSMSLRESLSGIRAGSSIR